MERYVVGQFPHGYEGVELDHFRELAGRERAHGKVNLIPYQEGWALVILPPGRGNGGRYFLMSEKSRAVRRFVKADTALRLVSRLTIPCFFGETKLPGIWVKLLP